MLLLLAAAGLFALRNRWAPLLGVLITAFISFGAVVTPNIRNHLADPSAMGVFAGTVIQTMGLVAGLLAGLGAASSRMRRTTDERPVKVALADPSDSSPARYLEHPLSIRLDAPITSARTGLSHRSAQA